MSEGPTESQEDGAKLAEAEKLVQELREQSEELAGQVAMLKEKLYENTVAPPEGMKGLLQSR